MAKEDIGIDIGSLKKIFNKKYAGTYLLILLLIIPLVTSVYLRMQPAYMPKADDWARSSVYNNIKSGISQQVRAQYPNLPTENLNTLVNEQFDSVLEQGTINSNGQELNIEKIVDDNADFLRQKFQTDSGQTYLLAIDPYFYYRLTRNAVQTGSQFDTLDDNGLYYDSKVLAGRPREGTTDQKIAHLHVAIQTIIAKIVRFFAPGTDILAVAFYTPVLIGTLAVIPAFFVARKFGGNVAGFFSGMLVGLHPAFLTRTAGGFSDTDAYNVFFPLLIMWLALYAIEAKTLRASLIWAAFGGIAVGLFSYAWNGWYFIYNFILAAVFISMFYRIMIQRKKITKKVSFLWTDLDMRKYLSFLGVFSVISWFVIAWVKSPAVIVNFVQGIIRFTQIKDVGVSSIWPNVYTTVAELNPASLNQTITQISLGSKVWLFIAFMGIMTPLLLKRSKVNSYFIWGSAVWYLGLIVAQRSFTSHIVFAILLSFPLIARIMWSFVEEEELDIKASVVLLIWFMATIYASSNGVRFILLMVPAFSVAAGIAVGNVTQRLSEWLSKEMDMSRALTYSVMSMVFVAILFYPINIVGAAKNTVVNEIPSMNDDWYNALQKINLEAEDDAIINSWWDFGHWFAAIGNRSVTLDGGRQNNPQAHFLGKLMVTWDEQESIGILRYLDCGSNTGFDTLSEYIDKPLEVKHTIDELILSDEDEAMQVLLEKGLSTDEARNVLQYTHCDPPENYFITSEDMVGKSGVWAHFGSWNFTKSSMYSQVINKNRQDGVQILQDEFGFNQEDASDMYQEIQNANADRWIAPWPGYAGQAACNVDGNQVQCNNGVLFDLETNEAYLQVGEARQRPKAVAYVDDGEFIVDEYESTVLLPQTQRGIGVAMIPNGNSYTALLMDYALTGSMFTRLFFFENDDKGLAHFEKFHEVVDVTGQKIIIWKVDWEGMVEEAEVTDFVQCLSDSGAVMYGTETCSWCNRQKELLDSDGIPFVDCANGACEGISSYPTWEIDGERTTGYKTLEELSELSGCPLETAEQVETTDEAIEEEPQNVSEYSLVKIDHILVSKEGRTEDEAAAIADELLELAQDDFDSALNQTECSDDTVPCNLGWFGKGVLGSILGAQEIEDAAFGMQEGDISSIIETQYGYSIVRLIDTK